MHRVMLIHWKEAEVPERLARLKQAGLRAHPFRFGDGPAAIDAIRADPPDAIVIDLSRLPSHGRETALALRQMKPTRGIPLVFVEGEPEKVERIRSLLPDATYASWRSVASAVQRAIKRRPEQPVVPRTEHGYSQTPLPQKLGIKANSTVLLMGAPRGFERTLGDGGRITRSGRSDADLILFFASSGKELVRGLPKAGRRLASGGSMWVAWPKRASGVATDLTESIVRETCLAAGLVDYKVCAIDATWSGLKFARRRL